MNKQSLFVLSILLLASLHLAAQTTIQYTGPNTWGGAYVPPVWTKTYNQTLKTYNINVQPASSSRGQSNSGYAGSTSTLEKKSKWSFASSPVDYEAIERRRAYKNKKAQEIAVKYAKTLDEAIAYYNMGFYRGCYNTITRILTDIYLKEIKENNNSDEVYENIDKYKDVKNYYQFMSGVKAGATDNAQFTYRMYLTTEDKYIGEKDVTEVTKPYPYISRYYYFLDTINSLRRVGFDKYSLQKRFLADLYFVELLVDLGRKEEGKKIFNAVLNFYLPKVDSVEAFLPQIAINHFYLGNVDEASDLLEYYWNETESYTARLAVLNQLVIGDGFQQKNNWSRENNPKEYAFVKKNYLFLDSIIKARNLNIEAYNKQVKYTLFVTRGKEYDYYLQMLEPKIKIPFDSLYASKYYGYTSYNDEVEHYLLVLLEKGDKDKIREILKRVYDVAIKKKNLMLTNVDAEIKKAYEYKNAPKLYWEVYYNRKQEPAANALDFFVMKKFALAGGKKYLREIAKPLIDELSDYTKEECKPDIYVLEECGIKPDFLKKRKYLDYVPVSEEETNAKIALQNKKELDEKNRLLAIENERTKVILAPLTKEEEEFKKTGVPFGALAMFEYAIKNKKIVTKTLFDSISMEYASICFQKLGYEKGRSLKADILMASTVKDKSKIYEFIKTWTRQQLLDNWYKGAIKSDKQTPLGVDIFYEEQYIDLLRMAGRYDSVSNYIGNCSWATAIKFAVEHTEALVIIDKYKEAMIWISNFEYKTLQSINTYEYDGWSELMKGIVYFHKKEFKKAWENLYGPKVNINGLYAKDEKKWKYISSITTYDNPRIFTYDKFAYYYFCCAKEVKKKNFEDCIQVITVPKTAPSFIIEKYGGLFKNFEK